ncbi:MAG TPA: hypothetical protein VKQ30_24375 [Ktedonobacterales bacterium]|nr:hypothetical protein [Ktedonobacterales bacterium]
MNSTKAQRLWRKAGKALGLGDRQAYYRLGVAAVDAENAWRRAMGWQAIAVSPASRAIAEGRVA